MLLYSYYVYRELLTHDQRDALQDDEEIKTALAPREARALVCFDCIFPNGDIHPLTSDSVDLTSCIAVS